MSLNLVGTIELPASAGPGGFDHAAVCGARLYVAHTANDCVEVIDCLAKVHLTSVRGLKGVAGVLASNAEQTIFTANRDEDTISIIPADSTDTAVKVPVGFQPNGLAYADSRRLLLSANVGKKGQPGTASATIISTKDARVVAHIPMPGCTRWAMFSPSMDAFFINIADPACIAVVDAGHPAQIARTLSIPATGPHGLDLDERNQRLFCACDDAKLLTIDPRSGAVLATISLSGAPDTIFHDGKRERLYVAIGEPGVVDIVDTKSFRVVGTVKTEVGAHTVGYDEARGNVYAFLPNSHRALVLAC